MNTHTRPIMRHDLKPIAFHFFKKNSISAALNSRRKFGSVPGIRHVALFKIFSARQNPCL